MASIIPERLLQSIKRIAELEQPAYEALVQVLEKLSPALTRDEFAENASKTLSTIPPKDLQEILTSILVLYRVKDKKGLSNEDISQKAVESLSHAKNEEIKISEEKQPVLKDRIKKLLSFDASVGVTAKALDVMTDQDRVFCNARILSDIRPVFTTSLESASAAVIVHTLRIGFHQDDKHQDFYFALDGSDLKALKEIILRAEKKTKALEAILEKSNTKCLKV
jgi:hypothetical protein